MSYTVFPQVFFIAFTSLAFAVLSCRARLKSVEKKFSNTCGILLVAYILILFYLTLVSNRSENLRYLMLTPFSSYKFILTTYNSFDVLSQIFQNILVFIPAGILIPEALYIKNKKHSCVKTVLLGLFMSFFIELSQFVNAIGYSEFDDLFNNSLGCFIGFGIFWFCNKIYADGEGVRIKKEAFKGLLPLLLTVTAMFLIIIYREFVLYYR